MYSLAHALVKGLNKEFWTMVINTIVMTLASTLCIVFDMLGNGMHYNLNGDTRVF